MCGNEPGIHAQALLRLPSCSSCSPPPPPPCCRSCGPAGLEPRSRSPTSRGRLLAREGHRGGPAVADRLPDAADTGATIPRPRPGPIPSTLGEFCFLAAGRLCGPVTPRRTSAGSASPLPPLTNAAIEPERCGRREPAARTQLVTGVTASTGTLRILRTYGGPPGRRSRRRADPPPHHVRARGGRHGAARRRRAVRRSRARRPRRGRAGRADRPLANRPTKSPVRSMRVGLVAGQLVDGDPERRRRGGPAQTPRGPGKYPVDPVTRAGAHQASHGPAERSERGRRALGIECRGADRPGTERGVDRGQDRRGSRRPVAAAARPGWVELVAQLLEGVDQVAPVTAPTAGPRPRRCAAPAAPAATAARH